jgi:flagellar motor switch/type III secretory pathway protein FliN
VSVALDALPSSLAPARPPRLDEPTVRARAAVVAALDGLMLDELRVSVLIPDQDEAFVGEQVAFATPHGPVRVAPLTIDGAAFENGDHAALLAAVSTLEPLLAALEDAGAEALTPVGVRSDTFDAAHVEVRLSDGERTLHEARLSLPPGAALRLRRVGDQAPGLNLPLPVRLLIEGPRLSPDDLSSLRAGDLLLIPALERAWSARLSIPGGTVVGLFAPASRNFTHQRKESRMTEAAAPPAEDEHRLTPGPDTPIAVTVDLGETAAPLKTLTELRPGAVLPLTGLDAEMRVTLRSAGQAFARGRLVSLGETYAVLIDAVADPKEAV